METKVESLQESLKEPNGIELFTISHYFNPQHDGIEISFNIGVRESTKQIIILIGKEKQYMDYLQNINEIFKQFGEKINCLTLEFAKNNLANDKLEKHLFNELEDEFLQSLKVLLGGKK